MVNLEFFKNKKIFITGNTGFKGAWLSKILIDAGSILKGYALKPEENSLFNKINLSSKMECVYGDVCDFELLNNEFQKFNPEIVIHLAAQPLVRESYKFPKYTYETNINGTINILECVRNSENVKSFLNVTTDKVYENIESINYSYKESDKLNGYDPYSNSKSCSELITESYKNSFLKELGIAVSTARAGNVIGGGDISKDRIISDCIKFTKMENPIIVRNPYSIRPYQYVLDALFAYLLIIQKQYENINYQGNYNIGPEDEDIVNTEMLVKIFCDNWGQDAKYIIQNDNGPHESKFLKLDCNKMKNTFNWKSKYNINKTVQFVVEFEKSLDKELCMENQIKEFIYGK